MLIVRMAAKKKQNSKRRKRRRKIVTKMVGYGVKKRRRTRKKQGHGRTTNGIAIDRKQLAGVSPLDSLDLYRSQLATAPK